MKIIEKEILEFQENDYFFPLRNKIDYVKLLMFSARKLITDYGDKNINTASKMQLIISKMSRLFFYKENKYFSVSFPFNTILNDDNSIVEIKSYSGKIVDSQNISSVMSILNNDYFINNPSTINMHYRTDGEDDISLELLEELLQLEPSYIRYDNDSQNQNGRLHPLHHLDINYSTHSTFKLGLENEINYDYFQNLLDVSTDCVYVSD